VRGGESRQLAVVRSQLTENVEGRVKKDATIAAATRRSRQHRRGHSYFACSLRQTKIIRNATPSGSGIVLIRSDPVLHKLTGPHRLDARYHSGRVCSNGIPIIGGQLEDGDFATGEILLVAQILVRRDKQVIVFFGQAQQVPVFESAPAAPLRTGANMFREVPGQRPRNALVENDLHAANSAASDISSTWQAISRVTDGKHSRNCSRL